MLPVQLLDALPDVEWKRLAERDAGKRSATSMTITISSNYSLLYICVYVNERINLPLRFITMSYRVFGFVRVELGAFSPLSSVLNVNLLMTLRCGRGRNV